MAKVYYELIKANAWEITRVPNTWKDQTISLFAADVANGKLKEAKFEQYTDITYAEYIA